MSLRYFLGEVELAEKMYFDFASVAVIARGERERSGCSATMKK